jgi:hypothetical protein
VAPAISAPDWVKNERRDNDLRDIFILPLGAITRIARLWCPPLFRRQGTNFLSIERNFNHQRKGGCVILR